MAILIRAAFLLLLMPLFMAMNVVQAQSIPGLSGPQRVVSGMPGEPQSHSVSPGTVFGFRKHSNPISGPSVDHPTGVPMRAGGGNTGLPRGRRYFNGRYFGSFNNRFYSPQYGYF